MNSIFTKCISIALVSCTSAACFGSVSKENVGTSDRVVLKFDQNNTNQIVSNFSFVKENLGSKEWTSSFVDETVTGTVKYDTKVFPWPQALDFSNSFNGSGFTISRPVPAATKFISGTDLLTAGLKVNIRVTMIPKEELEFYAAGNRSISVYAALSPTIFPSLGGLDPVQIGFGCRVTNPDGSFTSNPGGINKTSATINGLQMPSHSHPSYDISKCTDEVYLTLTYGVSSSVSINEISWTISQLN